VERGVGLDDAALRLCLQVREHLRAGPGHHVDPRRKRVQWERELWFLQDEQRADHLRPCGPALRWRSDDDVAGAKFEAVPAVAVVDSPSTALSNCNHVLAAQSDVHVGSGGRLQVERQCSRAHEMAHHQLDHQGKSVRSIPCGSSSRRVEVNADNWAARKLIGMFRSCANGAVDGFSCRTTDELWLTPRLLRVRLRRLAPYERGVLKREGGQL